MKRTQCPRGHTVSQNTNYCGLCGTRMVTAKSAGTAEPVIRKVAGANATESASGYRRVMDEDWYSEPDPAVREVLWQAVYGPTLTKAR